jgi:hypothetical protein
MSAYYRGLFDDEELCKRHMNHVFSAMKMPPSTTICRLNYHYSEINGDVSDNEQRQQKQTVMDDLTHQLQAWIRERSSLSQNNETKLSLHISEHPVLPDVVRVDVNSSIQPLCACKVPPTTQTSHDKQYYDYYLNQDWRVRAGWPKSHKVVICDRLCGEAVLRGSDIYVRGVQCTDAGIVTGEEIAVYADLGVTTMTASTSSDNNDKDTTSNGAGMVKGLLLAYYTGRTCVFLGLGVAACPRATMFNSASGLAVRMSATHRAGPCLPPMSEMEGNSRYYVLQNLPSITVCHALQPQPNDIILDMCAAPGNKSSHLASLCPTATIIACDKSPTKVVAARNLFDDDGGDAEENATCFLKHIWSEEAHTLLSNISMRLQ